MNAWDEELSISEETPVYYISPKKSTKFISFYFTKYAATVCIYLSVSIQYYNIPYYSIDGFVQTENGEETVKGKPDTTSNSSIPSEALAEVTTVRKNSTVIEEGMGMTGNSILIIENNQQARKESIINAIEKYQKLLEKEFAINKVIDTPISKELKIRIDRLNNELNLLNEREQKYLFDGKVLTLYVSIISKENRILAYKDNYYLVKDTVFYTLTTSGKLQYYKKVTDTDSLTALNKIMN
jgi:hypothetical protein